MDTKIFFNFDLDSYQMQKYTTSIYKNPVLLLLLLMVIWDKVKSVKKCLKPYAVLGYAKCY